MNEIIQCIKNIQDNPVPENLSDLKDKLNACTNGSSECTDVLYTTNIDHMSFGVMVFPLIAPDSIRCILINGENIHIHKYILELDSKIFEYLLEADEIAAILMYNIYHMTNGTRPIERLRSAIDIYFATAENQLHIKESIQYQKILELGLIDTLVKFTNCLYADPDVLTDAYLDSVELGESFTTAISKLFGNQIPGTENTASRSPKLVILDWCFRLYANVKTERIPAINQLKRSKELQPSALYNSLIDKAIDALYKIDTDTFVNEAYDALCYGSKQDNLFHQTKHHGLDTVDEDFYEFLARTQNVESDDDAMYALKGINIRLSVLDDYLHKDGLSEEEYGQWSDIYNKYTGIRDDLIKNDKFDHSVYGTVFNYNS